MSDIILKVEDISKQYRLGLVGTGSLQHDIKRSWYKVRGKEDPFLKVGSVNDRSAEATENYIWALKDIDFEVKRGDILGIIGKNGAGKSTLLKLLSRVTMPTTGIIKSRGTIASLLEVGTGFHPELTGRENIYLNGAILGMTKAEIRKKEEEIVEFSGCKMYIDTPVKRYSSGMIVRLAFAVAAHLEPDILIVDEVLAVGDKEFQKKAIGKMQDISSGDGRTVLFVSHNMDSVQSLCNRGIVLDNGHIVFNGNEREAIQHYLKGQRRYISDYNELQDAENDFAKVHSVSLNRGSDIVRIEDDITVEIEFTLLQNTNQRVDISFAILNDSDQVIAIVGSSFLDSCPVKNTVGLKQKIQFVLKRPHLNSGIYSTIVRVIENRAGRARLRVDDPLSFEVRAEMKDGIYFKTKGVIQPEVIISMKE